MEEILYLLNPWWLNKKFSSGIPRPKYNQILNSSLRHKRAVLIVGSRRTGKTTLLHQLIKKLLQEKTNPKQILYLLLDHPKLSSYKLLEIVQKFRQIHELKRSQKLYLFFDEVQYSPNWEQQTKALFDTEKVKIYLSGSASSQLLLKSPYLTGRLAKFTIFPANFQEFLTFKKIALSPSEHYLYPKIFDKYLQTGGYPEYLLQPDPTYFPDLINNILYKDIVALYGIRNPDLIRDLLLLLADRSGHQTSYNKLANILGLNNDTVKEYIYYLKNSLLLTELPRHSTSRSKRIYSAKKFYLNDNGLLFSLTGKINLGSAAEQTLLHHLNDKFDQVNFHYENQREIDFIVNNQIAIESKYQFNSSFTKNLKFYVSTAKDLGIKTLYVANRDQKK
ncbi:ATP-binding protein [Patescibacteria group bacterium]|nr:ATP-binding protein [Patescibacteria group bacterium]